jgi:hypothetical protein
MRRFIWPGQARLVTVQRNWPLTTGYDILWDGKRVNDRAIPANELQVEVEKVIQRMTVQP